MGVTEELGGFRASAGMKHGKQARKAKKIQQEERESI